MKRYVFATITVTLLAVLSAGTPAFAHHSHAMFDGSKLTLLEGTITGVRFANPHVFLQMKVTKKDNVALAAPETWAVEMSTTQNETSRGVTPNILTYGASIVLTLNPLFSGEHSGNYRNIVSINGVKNMATDESWKPAT
jgi:hypothetical protein